MRKKILVPGSPVIGNAEIDGVVAVLQSGWLGNGQEAGWYQRAFHDNSYIDLFGFAYEIPADNETFGSAIYTAVLEHLEEPEQALRECHRVLKPGSFAIYSLPFIWHLHEEPRDFYRFSKYSLKYFFEKTGFEIVELEALSGFWVNFGQMFVCDIYRFHRGPLHYFPFIPVIGLVIQGVSYILDRIDKNEQWTWTYMAVARKT